MDIRCFWDGDTPLTTAARWGHRDMVALLLDRGADPNMVGRVSYQLYMM